MRRKRECSITHLDGCLHIETPLGIVNIRMGLKDQFGRRVVSVMVSPDAYIGEPRVKLSGLHNTRLIQLKGKGRKTA